MTNYFPWALFAVSVAILAVLYLSFQREIRLQSVKDYVDNIQGTNFKTVWGVWLIVLVVVVSLILLTLRVVFPTKIGDVQIDFVWAIYALVAALASLGTLQYKFKRDTEDPAITTANAAAKAQRNASPPAPPPNVTVESDSASVKVEQPDSVTPTTAELKVPAKKKVRKKLERDA